MIAQERNKWKISKSLLSLTICSLLAVIPLFGQLRTKEERRLDQVNRQVNENAEKVRQASMQGMEATPPDQGIRKLMIKKDAWEKRRLSREERALRAPLPGDLLKYKEFLKQPKTGLFRLFPDFGCESKNTVIVDDRCAKIAPISWSYSFRRKDYSNLDFLDIHYKDGDFISKAFLSQGILVSLGDVLLESLLPTSRGIKFLLDFKPATGHEEAKKQFIQISRGIEADGFTYAKNVRVAENTTYAARVVAYRPEDKVISRVSPQESAEDLKLLFLKDDKRIDLTVAFRVVRTDENGGITILWKELNRQPAPKIIFPKKTKASDIKLSD